MSDSPPPALKPKMSPALRVIVVICGIAAMTAGILQVKRGIGKMSGGDPEVTRLSKESDAAFEAANKHLAEAGPLFKSVLDSIDTDGLAAVRQQKKEAAQKAGELFGKAAEQLRTAAQKADEAAARNPDEKGKSFLEGKSLAFQRFAESRAINQEIARMILDESIKTGEELIPKVLEAAKRRDEIEASAVEASARADKIVAEAKK